MDNKESHGPGGQYQHALEEQGDSCFGKITRGKENAAHLFAQPVFGDRSEWHYFMVDPVEIVKVEILNGTQTKIETPVKVEQEVEEPPHDPVEDVNAKMKRKPRRPKINHEVEP